MKKIILLSLFFSTFAFSDYLYQPSNVCIKSYYYKNGYIYYTLSDTGAVVTASTKNLGDDIFIGYEYNASNNTCSPKASNNSLGMRDEDFNLLNSFIGILVFILLVLSFL